MMQTLEATGWTYMRLQLFSRNSSEDVELQKLQV